MTKTLIALALLLLAVPANADELLDLLKQAENQIAQRIEQKIGRTINELEELNALLPKYKTGTLIVGVTQPTLRAGRWAFKNAQQKTQAIAKLNDQIDKKLTQLEQQQAELVALKNSTKFHWPNLPFYIDSKPGDFITVARVELYQVLDNGDCHIGVKVFDRDDKERIMVDGASVAKLPDGWWQKSVALQLTGSYKYETVTGAGNIIMAAQIIPTAELESVWLNYKQTLPEYRLPIEFTTKIKADPTIKKPASGKIPFNEILKGR